MVDPERGELDQDGRRGQQQRNRQHRDEDAAGSAPRRQEDRARQPAQQQQRHQRTGGDFGPCRPKQRLQHQDQRGDRHVDDARPVHRSARRRVCPVLADVPEILAMQPVADLLQPHGVIGIAEFECGQPVAEQPEHDRAAQGPEQQDRHADLPTGDRGCLGKGAAVRRGRRCHISGSHRRTGSSPARPPAWPWRAEAPGCSARPPAPW